MANFYMLVGLPGSGKSYYADELTKLNTNLVVHSSDSLRKELFGSEDIQDRNNELFIELHNRIKRDLRRGIDVVYDATNINRKRRTSFINNELKDIECNKVCIFVATPYKDCLHLNSTRDRKVPEDVIKRMYLNFNIPCKQEGWDDILVKFNYINTTKDSFNDYNFFHGNINACNIDHDNPHHKLSIGDHCLKASKYVSDRYSDNHNLMLAALLHDIGKIFTKSRLNTHGELDDVSHYYFHENCGAYDSTFYLNELGLSVENILYVANLINYHMTPFNFSDINKFIDKYKNRLDESFILDLFRLHEADVNSELY